MGANLVSRAVVYAADIPLKPNEFRLLVGMCLTAMDSDPQPRYFDAREASALALGRRVPDANPDDKAAERERAAAFQAVKVALLGLIQVGAIKRAVRGRTGRRAEYLIVLDAAASKTRAEARKRLGKGTDSLPIAVGNPTLGEYEIRTAQVGDSYPPGTTGTTGTTEEEQAENASTSPAPVDNSPLLDLVAS